MNKSYMEVVFMKVIVRKCNGGEWYGKALNRSFEVVKKVGNKYYEVKVEPEFAYLLNGRKKGYIYTSDADVI